jgi:hypothetical protein
LTQDGFARVNDVERFAEIFLSAEEAALGVEALGRYLG